MASWKKILVEILIVLLFYLLERVWRVVRLKRPFGAHQHWIWSVLWWVLAVLNLGGYWIAYPLIGWMVIGIGLIFVQAIGNHQFVYATYWPVFWRLSFYYSGLVWVVSLFLHHLPLI